MDGLGCHAESCSCRSGLMGFGFAAQHLLVMDVFWFAPCRLGAGRCQPVASGCIDRYQDVQADQVGGFQPDDTVGSVAVSNMGLELFSLASERWRSGLYLLADQLADASGQDSQVITQGVTDQGHQN